ncbi:unnamed protein product [Phytophthora fragariaefolia]|uniref:Unnamed protein product n=1 Tax=Phytophthora fragariaefolia TaxID=1490495 RepID=A0A9W7D0N0_9STRA|nr:unnamed protein product [Phytophthora fragariaefolia]
MKAKVYKAIGPDVTDDFAIDEDCSELEEDEVREAFDPANFLPTILAEVEAIQNMRFSPSEAMDAPSYLFQHADSSTKTYLRPEFKPIFEHSASSSFLVNIPLYFWRHVVDETNKYAVLNDIRIGPRFTISELKPFLGIIFYMDVNAKGEYANYWDLPANDIIFGGVTTSLDVIMSLNRFKLIRRCLSFNIEPTRRG